MGRIAFLTLALVLMMSGLALAEPPEVPPVPERQQQQQINLFQTFFDLRLWVNNISRDVSLLGRRLQGFVLALVLLGFVYGILQGIAGGGLEAIQGAFVRLAVVSLLLSLWTGGTVGESLRGAMAGARDWGVDRIGDSLNEAATNLDELALRIAPFLGALAGVKLLTAKVAQKVVKTKNVSEKVDAGNAKLVSYLNWTTLLLIPMMLFFFIIIVVASFTLEVGVALFPLAAAMLIFPRGSAADWFGKWVAAVMGALLLVILLPVGFKAAVDIGINRPVYQVNAYMEGMLEAIEAVKEQNMEAIRENCTFPRCLPHERWLSERLEELKEILAKVGVVLQAWLLGIILLIAGMAAAAYVLFNVERVAMSFIGGFVATGVRQMLGTASLGGRVYSSGGVRAGTGRADRGSGPPALGGPGPTIISPRPVAYDIQPYGGSNRGEVINVEWRQISGRELSPGFPPRSLAGSSDED